MITDVKLVQFLNALPCIIVTPSGIVIEVKALQSKNAFKPIDVTANFLFKYETESGMIISPVYFSPSVRGITAISVDEIIE